MESKNWILVIEEKATDFTLNTRKESEYQLIRTSNWEKTKQKFNRASAVIQNCGWTFPVFIPIFQL